MPRRKKSTKLRGASRMKEQGYKQVNVWLDNNEQAVIERAARLVGKKLATFIREAAFGAAGQVLNADLQHLGPHDEMWEKMICHQAALAVEAMKGTFEK